jgi:hypothetical protein
MGILDEAIREHLELKRRRGADPGEVARQEHEALGPARRVSEDAAPPGAAGVTGAVALSTLEARDEAPPAPDDEPHVAVPFEPVDEPVRPDAPGGPHGARGEDDVLDRTPDFLQETPEHDRLWFEQRPPRDFDFDG